MSESLSATDVAQTSETTVKDRQPSKTESAVRNKYPNARKYESSYEDYINDSNSAGLIPAQRINLITTSQIGANSSIKKAVISQTPNSASVVTVNQSTP